MFYRIQKFVVNLASIIGFWLTWRFFKGTLDWNLTAGALGLGGFWLVFVALRLNRLFATYADVLSRLRVLMPLGAGLLLAYIGYRATDSDMLKLLALWQAGGWGLVYVAYRYNKRRYKKQGRGPLPKRAWVNPDPEAIKPGDLLLFSGMIASTLQETVGHGELALRSPDGRLLAFSSWMECGVLYNDLADLCKKRMRNGHYVVVRPVRPFTQAQINSAWQASQTMLAQNIAWREKTNQKRKRIIELLPLPASWKSRLFNRFKASGYDWLGLFSGFMHKDRWVCIAADLEVYQRIGYKTNRYGSGLLGLGTGLLDPIMPVRFLSDPNFRLLTVADKKRYESSKTGS